MCGIAGMMMKGARPAALNVLAAFNRALAHRGPDGEGVWADGPVGLAHTRLAIIDLETGDQPLFGPAVGEGGATVLVGNGEIYNNPELRQRLPAWPFRTRSDFEPLLALYDAYGAQLCTHLRGMYAFALWDPRGDGRLILARDPFGIKPLYLLETADGLYFASEPRAFFAAGLATPVVEAQGASELFQLQFTCGVDTVYQGITRLAPGETVEIVDGAIVARHVRSKVPAGPPVGMGEADAVAGVDKVLSDSVAVHLRADVPYGLFLSSGVDSASVLTLMRRLTNQPVLTFTAGFDRQHVSDERERAETMAKATGAKHTSILVTEDDFWTHLPSIAASTDDPVADYAIVPTWLLARRAREDVKVVLSGEGGDELFAGYGRYRHASRLIAAKPLWRRGIFDRLGLARRSFNGWQPTAPAAGMAHAPSPAWNRLQRAQALDMQDWLPNDLLMKLDRCLMAHGVEGRTPFLDPAVAALAFPLPNRLKYGRGKLGKLAVRLWLETALPEAHAMAPKSGFTVPVTSWIAGRGETLGPLVARSPFIQAWFDADGVERYFRSSAITKGLAGWVLLYGALWHKQHVEQVDLRGAPVIEALSA